ncbi:hypothetical protein Rhein_3185 [Rheinheimera sp. A13L]|uniref:hypothetical protein n=1 Tax=Rheinheimera sp. A13L TaxID=506534 RepID=UPI0002125658|nr:hypothetical protein [Rheinheimera sp. A13L]EGM76718.1 hypothetical protein Rhein_3185 [Rheinheimera sp. A13L]
MKSTISFIFLTISLLVLSNERGSSETWGEFPELGDKWISKIEYRDNFFHFYLSTDFNYGGLMLPLEVYKCTKALKCLKVKDMQHHAGACSVILGGRVNCIINNEIEVAYLDGRVSMVKNINAVRVDRLFDGHYLIPIDYVDGNLIFSHDSEKGANVPDVISIDDFSGKKKHGNAFCGSESIEHIGQHIEEYSLNAKFLTSYRMRDKHSYNISLYKYVGECFSLIGDSDFKIREGYVYQVVYIPLSDSFFISYFDGVKDSQVFLSNKPN